MDFNTIGLRRCMSASVLLNSLIELRKRETLNARLVELLVAFFAAILINSVKQ